MSDPEKFISELQRVGYTKEDLYKAMVQFTSTSILINGMHMNATTIPTIVVDSDDKTLSIQFLNIDAIDDLKIDPLKTGLTVKEALSLIAH